MRQNRLRGLTSRREPETKSQKVSDSHRNDVSPLTQSLRYRAACDVCSRPVNFIGREIFVREEYCRTFQTGAFSVVLTDIGLLTDSLVDYMKNVSEYRNVHFAVRCILR